MTTLALYCNKGGVGKTTAAVNLAFLAAETGRSTLICDLDPQGATSFYFRVQPKLKRKARGLLQWGKAIENSIKGTDYPRLDLLPADDSHRNLDVLFSRQKRSRQRLAMVLEPLHKEYDLIVLDCPPTINLLTENIFEAADNVLVPLMPTTLSVRSYEQLLILMTEWGSERCRLSAFLSMVDGRKKLHRQLAAELHAGVEGLLSTAIPYRSEVEQMGLHRQPLPAFAPRSYATQSYRTLWAEIAYELLA